MPVLIIFKAAN